MALCANKLDASHTEERQWCPLLTAFDSASTAPPLTEGDIPTRPVTPRNIEEETNDESAIDGTAWEEDAVTMQAKWNARLRSSLERERERKREWRRRQARQQICGVCSIDLTAVIPGERVAHFNQCWYGNRRVPTIGSCSAVHQQDSENVYTLDVSSSRPGVTAPTNSVEDFSTTTGPNPSTCAFCSESLVRLSDLDAFHHRYVCWDRMNPSRCSICLVHFSHVFGGESWTMEEVLWHVHNCQHGGFLSLIEKDDFDILFARWKGRMQAVWRFVHAQNGQGPGRENWTHRDHERLYRLKQARGYEYIADIYMIPQTTLRRTELYDDLGEVKIIKSVESNSRVWGDIERSRRSVFTIFCSPGPDLPSKTVDSTRQAGEPGHETRYEKRGRRFSSTPITVKKDYDASTISGDLGDEEEERGRSQTRICFPSRRKRKSSRETRRHEAVENARKAGLRIPPGFELRCPAAELDSSGAGCDLKMVDA